MTIGSVAFYAVEMAAVTLWSVIISHIFGSANRKLSEKYGLVVYLCGNRCHRNGEKAVHRCKETAQYLHEYGQRKAMAEQGWTIEQFREVFGRNYIE